MKATELIKNADGSVFHLHLKPGDVAGNVILVGDPGRVDIFESLLRDIRVKRENREFKTITGVYGNDEITVISTGIGTDNTDIVVNELDAVVNIDLETGEIRDELSSLNIIRVGTSGSLRKEIQVGSIYVTETAVGFDGLLHFYEGYDWLLDTTLADLLAAHLEWPDTLPYPYAVNASKELLDLFTDESSIKGLTISAPGFYGPQGRKLRLETFDSEINEKLASFSFRGRTIGNYEMESSALYGLARMLGHRALTVCVVLGNRVTGDFIADYKPLMKSIAEKVLNKITFAEEI